MINADIIYGVLFLLGAFLYYKIHKSWLKTRNEDKSAHKPLTMIHKIKDWFIIFALIILALIYFLK